MRVLVTGAAGFIGSRVADLLESDGHQVVPFDRRLGQDITSRHDLEMVMWGVDHVIHLAGVLGTHELFDAPHEAIRTNVNGTLNVLQSCAQHGAGFTGITMPQVFPSVYTATKVCATRLATAWHREFGVPVAHVRAFNAFGPRQAHGPGHPQKIIPTFATCAWRGEPLPVWGDGSQKVDLISSLEVARILVETMALGDDQVVDAGTGIGWSVLDVAKHVIDRVGEGTIELLPMRRGEIPTDVVATGEGWEHLSHPPRLDCGFLDDTIDSCKP